MENKHGKKRLPLSLLALIAALMLALFAVSCGNGGTSDSSPSNSGTSVSLPDGNAVRPDAGLPGYKTVSDPNLNVNSLRARRDELILGIKGGGMTKGYLTLFAEASAATEVVDDSIIVFELDPKNVKFDELVSKVNSYIGEAKPGEITEADCAAAAKLLYEDHDLNGLYGIYQTAYRFYANYVYMRKDYSVKGNGGYLSEDPDDLAGYKAKEIISRAKKLLRSSFKLESKAGEGHSDCSTDCNATYAKEYVEAFETDVVTAIVSQNTLSKNIVSDKQKSLDFYYYLIFKSGKYADETVNYNCRTPSQIVYGETSTNVETADALAERDYTVIRTMMLADYKLIAKDDADLEKRLINRLDAYFKKATVDKGLRRYMDVANERVNGFGMTAAIKNTDTEEERNKKIDKRREELALVEEYLRHFDALDENYALELSTGTVTINVKTVVLNSDEETEDGTGTSDNFKGADWNNVRDILNKYVGLTKDAVEAIRLSKADQYGISADATVSYNVDIANRLADTLTSRYGEEKPRYTGPKIADGFLNSYSINGSLIFEDKSTKRVEWFNTSYLEYVPGENEKIFTIDALNNILPPSNPISSVFNKIFPQEKIPSVKLTAVDKDGNEINCFDKNAKLKVVFGGIPAVERNINLILNNEDKMKVASEGLTDAEKLGLADVRSLRYYLSFSVLVPATSVDAEGDNQNISYIAMDEKELARIKSLNEGMRFKVELTFDKEKVEDASGFVAIGYNHSKIKFVSDNEQQKNDGDDVKMTFFLGNVTTAMSVGILSQDSFKNIALFVAIGVIALIVVALIIWIIVASVRRKKFKVKYNAMGGRFSNGQKVRFSRNLGYPNNPTRRGYQFMGWYTNKKCTKKFDAATHRGGCVTVYAKWLPQSKYDKLNEAQELITKRVCSDYRAKANGTAGTGVHQAAIGYDEDPRITKLEIEKLSYEAKKAEEERKAEEVRLQTIREIQAAKDNDNAKENAEKEAEKAKLALQQALAEREALISLAKAEERNKVLEELRAAEAAKAAAEPAIDEGKVNELIDSKLKAYDEQRAKEIASERSRLDAELAAKLAAEQAALAILAAAKKEEKPEEKFDAGKAFDELKAELLSYKAADDLDFGLNEDGIAVSIKTVGETVEVEADADADDLNKKGITVETGAKLPVKLVVAKDEDIASAKELIEETLYDKGYMKAEKAAVTECSDAERKGGYEFKLAKGKIASSPEEFFKLIRVYAKSFVAADEGEIAEKTLMKAFLAGGKIYIYLSGAQEGLNAADEAMKAEGLDSFMVVKTADDCKKAIAAISQTMRANNLVRYPSATNVKEDSSEKGFTYTLKA